MKVWIIQCDHKPVYVPMYPSFFPDDKDGYVSARGCLNVLEFKNNGEHYYDAVLYQRIESPTLASVGTKQRVSAIGGKR